MCLISVCEADKREGGW